jgi:hypothetical protein
MSKADWQKLNEIFADASELSATAQKEFLRRTCADNEDLRREIETILAASNRADEQDFLEADAFAAGAKILAEDNNEIAPSVKRASPSLLSKSRQSFDGI